MKTQTKQFVKKQRGHLPMKYARSTLRQLIKRQAITTADQLKEIEMMYNRFIETPLRSE